MENKTIEIQNTTEINGNDLFLNKQNIEDRRDIKTTALRVVGVMLILLASGVYLIQGAQALDPYARHFIFLGITGLFGILTWIIGGVLKEMKGARTFIALAVSTVPVLFTQMGSMIHAMVKYNSDAPGMLNFEPTTVGILSLIIGVTSAVTLPVVLLGNRILARPQAKALSLLLLALNLLLLFPVRQTLFVGIIMSVAVAAILFYIVKYFKQDSAVRTKEGTIAVSMLFIPVVIMALRSLMLYAEGTVFPGIIWILTGITLTILPQGRKSVIPAALQMLGAASVVTGWGVMFSGLAIEFEALQYYVQTLPAAALLFGLSFVMHGELSRGVRSMAVMGIIGVALLGQISFGGPYTALISIVAGISLIAGATKLKEKTPLVLGTIALGSGVIGMLLFAISAINASSWILLMLGGIVIIVGGSLTELFNNQWKGYAHQLKDEVTAWK